MSPRRSDYRTRKEYRWARKVEQREMMTRPIVNARPLSARIILTGILWFVVVFAAVGALPRHAGAGWGSLAIVVSTAAAIVFYRSRLCQRWGRAWDDYARKSRIKMVEHGDTYRRPVGCERGSERTRGERSDCLSRGRSVPTARSAAGSWYCCGDRPTRRAETVRRPERGGVRAGQGQAPRVDLPHDQKRSGRVLGDPRT